MQPVRKKSRKPWARVLAVMTALLVAAVAGVALAYPSVAATACPGCYGLTEVEDGVYGEAGMSGRQRAQVRQTVAEARRKVAGFYGGRVSSPTLLVCVTAACYDRIGGGKERGVAVLNRSVMLSPRGIDPVIASHEMSHVELHSRLESGAEVPQWFDEGLAVVVSDDARYLAPKPATAGRLTGKPTDRCLTATTGSLPATLDQWLTAATEDVATYAKSACAVSRWLDTNGGEKALASLISRLNAGEPFACLVPPPWP
ncbi:hypothetical protein [Nonomuraea aridisoli]|uniref:Peptidase MA-like domain-containing protein n=1 Tax=Nonomuraea aridisoli TaxID=2070368 RepID=A0A2W2D4S6_9ACTN|nr:hypothetical protein [Nonomuraea aridisoli]PZG07012.1 hypothetical protein C1J01_41750 [Nonomuraea aridisoli]